MKNLTIVLHVLTAGPTKLTSKKRAGMDIQTDFCSLWAWSPFIPKQVASSIVCIVCVLKELGIDLSDQLLPIHMCAYVL
jgi:hypothetical protein